MKKVVSLLLFTFILFTACKNENKELKTNSDMHSNEMHHDNDEHASTTNKKDHIETKTSQSDLSNQIVDAYIQLKNALVATNQKAAAEASKVLLEAFSSFEMSKLTDAQHKSYMEIVENAKEQAEHIVKSPMDHQREHFEVLSTDIIDLIALVGTSKTLYQDFCPMYNNNKGANWLSETKNIRNPYYGDKMMSCGKMQKQIN